MVKNKEKLISTYTKKDNFFKEQYNKFKNDPHTVLNVITIREQLKDRELVNEIEYLEDLKNKLSTYTINELILNAKKIKKESSLQEYEFVTTTVNFKKYFNNKVKEETKTTNLDKQKETLARFKLDIKNKKLKEQKKKLNNQLISNTQKEHIITNIENIQKKEIISENIKENKIENNKIYKNKFYEL
jgi:hypothetical protein